MRLGSYRLKIFAALAIAFAIANYIGVACSNTTTVVSQTTTNSKPEQPFCSSVNTFGDTVTVIGTAVFNVRKYSATAGCLGAETLGGPIKYAEVQLLDENNNIIQCGATAADGTFSLAAPRNHTLTVLVNSRAQGSHYNVSVLDAPDTNKYYSLNTSISTSTTASSVSTGTLTAPAKGTIGGGAFNIMWNILRANEALRAHICDSALTPGHTTGLETDINTPCSAFSVAPKVTVYWAPGVNPYTYFGGSASAGISFYVPGTDKLYILGGIGGQTDSVDTDHFDDAVISHEYGHFIEDHYAKTDSPGGSHDGNHVLDARLTWGEGWANFFSSFVRADKMYRDSVGNIDGTQCYMAFNYDIDLNKDGAMSLDIPQNSGEGNFREFAITRALWDIVDPLPDPENGGTLVGSNGTIGLDDNTSDGTKASFPTLWSVFHGIFPSSTLHFRNAGLFLKNDTDTSATSSAVTFQKITPDVTDYGKILPKTTGAGCLGTSISITANDNPGGCSIGGVQVCQQGNLNACCSNQLQSNDFYDVYLDGTISSISLSSSGPAEIDLYLYKDGYTFGDTNTIAASDVEVGAASRLRSLMNLQNLPIGHYMLNVNVYTGNGNPGTSTYQLYVNNAQVCP